MHLPHACAYPIARLKHEYRHPGYPGDKKFVPHGFSVIVTSPAAFRFTFDSDPARHIQAASMLTGKDYEGDDRDALPNALRSLMRDVEAPLGVREFGYDESDIPALVDGAMKQQRLLNVAPHPPTADDLARIFTESMG